MSRRYWSGMGLIAFAIALALVAATPTGLPGGALIGVALIAGGGLWLALTSDEVR